jgi:C4-dicarboxylate-specific signal transduction histidine kinase
MNREFCSDACKSRNYRDRKDKAQRLKAQGQTVAAISKELDTPAATIKNWTTKRKG